MALRLLGRLLKHRSSNLDTGLQFCPQQHVQQQAALGALGLDCHRLKHTRRLAAMAASADASAPEGGGLPSPAATIDLLHLCQNLKARRQLPRPCPSDVQPLHL